MLTEQEWADHERDLAHEAEHEDAMTEPDDLLTTVKAWLRKLDTRLIASKQPETDTLAVILEDLPCTVVDWLRALLARCEAAEGCDGNCSCVVMSRHEWQRAYSEERLKREAAEAEVERLNSPVLKSDWQQMVAERDALRLMNDPEGGEKQALIARLVKAESELAAARADAQDSERAAVAFAKQYDAAVAERDAARAEAARLKKELAAKIPGQVVQSIRDDRDRLRAEAARLREIVAHYGWCQECGDGPDCDDMVRMKAALDTPAREGGEG